MDEDKVNIDLKIDNMQFPMMISESQKEMYLNAVNLVNNKLDLYRSRFRNHSTNEIYCMVLLNLAVNVLAAQNNGDALPVINKLQELSRDLDDLLKDEAI